MSATLPLPLLQRVQIASPCPVRWEDMNGDDRTRHCGQCNLFVHNIANLTDIEAEALLRSAFNDDGTSKRRLCIGIYRRADGTILTANCPVGLAAVRAKTRRAVSRVAAAVGLTAVVAWAAEREASQRPFARAQPLTVIANYLRAAPTPPPLPPTTTRLMTFGSAVDPLPSAPRATSVTPVNEWFPGVTQ